MCPPNYPSIYCENPFVMDCPDCEGIWNCDDIYMISEEIIAEFDVNEDGLINLGDELDSEHLDLLMTECDMDADG